MKRTLHEIEALLGVAGLVIAGHAAMSCMNAFARIGVVHSNAGAVASIRFGVAAIILWTIWRSRGQSLPKGALLKVHLVRGCLIALGATCYFQAMSLMPLAQATALTFMAPILAQPLGALRLGERPNHAEAIALALGSIGVAITAWPAFMKGEAATSGLIWLAVGVIATATHMVLLRERAGRDGAVTTAMLASAIPAVASSPFVVTITWAALAPAVVAGVCGALGMTLAAMAAAKGTLARTSVLEFTKLPLAALMGWLTVGEIPAMSTALGGFVALVACQVARGRKSKPGPTASRAVPA